MKNDRNNVTHTKSMIVRKVANECGVDAKTVRGFYSALERYVSDALSSADDNADVVVRLFEGVTLNGTYHPEEAKVNNLTGENIVVPGRIAPRAHITRNYRDKINGWSR